MKGHFWTSVGEDDKSFQPKAQFRFRVEIDGFSFQDDRPPSGTSPDPTEPDYALDEKSDTKIVWYAKSIDKPTISVESTELIQLTQGYPAYRVPKPRSPTFNDITMTLVDPAYPNATRKILRWFRRTGYNDTDFYKFTDEESEQKFYESIGQMRIIQLDPSGKEIETWRLINVFPKEVNFGNLSYDSEELVEIKIIWSFETFTCEFPDYGEEKGFTYFNKPFGQTTSDPNSIRVNRNLGQTPKDDVGGAD